MLFTTLHWLLFLLATFTIFHLAPAKSRRWLMLGASVYFYATWSVKYLSLIAGQLVVDWTCGFLLGRASIPGRRKLIVAISVVVNLGALCVFKYWKLLAQSLHGWGVSIPDIGVELPLAISFYTFESMSYTIDVYRRRLEPVRSPLHLALFITWFPHLIAGPIIRPSELVPQLHETRLIDRERFFSGLALMVVGYSKKLLGADWMGRIADPIFAHPATYTTLDLVVGVYAYAFQIYFDFSAYTDIARGASRWFGVELPENFADPYLATSITDFWRRWHMTLSHWLRDYLYVPLGGSRLGAGRTYLNLFLTMLLGGLWHGASWTFVAWGALHGLYLAVERLLGVKVDSANGAFALLAKRVLTFHMVCVAWILFRATTFSGAAEFFRGLLSGTVRVSRSQVVPTVGVVMIVGGYWLVARLRRRLIEFVPARTAFAEIAYMSAIGFLVVFLTVFGASTNAFIYFQF